MPRKEIICYASALGGCSDVQSSEHYLSQGLFTSKIITVSGQKWLKEGEEKQLSKKKIGLKILCTTHNKLLSKLDGEAIYLFRCLDKSISKGSQRQQMPPDTEWEPEEYFVDGSKLERFMTKAVAGLIFEDKTNRWYPNGTLPVNPPENILKFIYGHSQLTKPMGLYFIGVKNELVENEERSGFLTLLDPETKNFVGSVVNFRNIQLLIWLSEQDITKARFRSMSGAIFGPGHNQPMYRALKFEFKAHERISSIIHFNWESN